VIHPWPLLGSGRSVAEGAPAMAGQRGGGSPARVRWATPGATGYGKRRKREQGIKTCSPKPGIEQRRRAEASTSGLGGGDGVVVADGVDAGALRLLGSTGSFGEFLRGPHGGQGGRGTTGGRETPRRRGSPAARSDRNPGAGRGANSELRLPGVPRGLGDAAAQLAGDRGMAGRRGRGGAGALRGGAARAGGARASCGCGRARWGAGEGQGAFKKGWPGISACARGKEIPGDLAGRFGAVAWSREGKERGGADGWGRSVSGGRRRAGRVAGLGEWG
jgi:hypothetical protein